MNDAQKLVDALLEGEDEKPKKKLPSWLAKIKGEKTEDDDKDGGEKKSDDPAPKESGGGGGGSKGGSSTTVAKTW